LIDLVHTEWYEESPQVRGDPDWMFDLADLANATIYYTTLGLMDPTAPLEVKGWRLKGFTWGGALGMTGARLMLMSVVGMMIVDPADKHRWGLDELPWWQENVEVYYEPIKDAPGDFWDWLGVESGRGILG